MTKVPDFTPAKWDKWLKDKKFAEDRVEHLEDELDKALDEQEKLSHATEEIRSERDAEKRLRVQAENDARRAKAAADQAAAAAAAASRSLKVGEKQIGNSSKDGEAQELRVEIQQLKAKNHGLNTQMDALAVDHERLAGLVAAAEKDKVSSDEESKELRGAIITLEREKEQIAAGAKAKGAEWDAMVASVESAKSEAASLEQQNQRLGDELDRLAPAVSKKSGVSAADLKAAIKAREEAEKHATGVDAQLCKVQAELATAREEMAAMQDEAEIKAGAVREGIAIADAQTAAVTEEAEALRMELSTLREEAQAASEERERSTAEHKAELDVMRQRATEADALCKEAEEKASAVESRANELEAELSESQRALKQTDPIASMASAAKEGNDEEGTTDQLLEMMSLLKDAESSKFMMKEELAGKKAKVDELQKNLDAKNAKIDELEREAAANGVLHKSNGERALPGGQANGDDSAAKVAAVQEELEDLHAMLNNVSAERDAALNELRGAADAGGGGGGGGGDAPKEEMQRVRQECEHLRGKVSDLEESQREGAMAGAGAKRVKSLEDQVERVSEEHTRQSEAWRALSFKMESEKEELSQELIAAKLQVAQLFMEVDGLKLRHRQATIAANVAHALEMESANASPTSSVSAPPSPASPHTMEL